MRNAIQCRDERQLEIGIKSRVNGMNETEGKAAMVAATERGKRRSFNKT